MPLRRRFQRQGATPQSEAVSKGVEVMASHHQEEDSLSSRALRRGVSGTAQRIRNRLKDPKTRAGTMLPLAAAVLIAGLGIYWIILLTELPSTADLERSAFEQATVVYSADGTELTTYQDKNRTWVELDQISEWVPQALIATEDHRFYEHSGIDVMRTISSTLYTLRGDVQGGSTITMQLARNAFPSIYDDWMITRKFKEWITAVRIEAMYEKDEILEMYLNTVPFMYNAFGIEAASQTYFQVPASDLNVRGAATLVSMLKGTVYYNPVRHPERSHERRNVVLEQMVQRGYLTPSEFETYRDEPTQLNFARLTRAEEPAPHFAEYLRQWLDDWAEQYGANLYTDGLRVHTTIDIDLQEAGQRAVDEITERLQGVADQTVPVTTFWERNPETIDVILRRTDRFRSLTASGLGESVALDSLRGSPAFVDSLQTVLRRVQAGFVALDPRDGDVLAWVGGRDFGEVQFDHVAMSRRQPGSTFKPFVYAAALDAGFTQTSLIRDEVVEYVDPDTRRSWRPSNVGQATGRLMTLADALAFSKNTVTAQLVQQIGPGRVVDHAHRMGIQSELDAVPSIGLGTSEVSLLEMSAAYATLANDGRYREPNIVTRIEDASGNVVERFRSEGRQAIPAAVAYSVLDMMRGVVDRGTGVRIRNTYGVRGDVAAKTGTSQNGADGWFMLAHPNIVMGAWVGFTSPGLYFPSSYYQQGAHTALPIVGRFYQMARDRAGDLIDPDVSFTAPAGWVEPQPVDTSSASDYLFASNVDSLEARRDSLYYSLSDTSGGLSLEDEEELPLDSLGMESVFDDDDDGEEDDGDEDGFDDGEEFDGEPEEGIEGIEAADSLNRLERSGDA